MNPKRQTASQSLITAFSLIGLLAGIIAFRQFAWPQIEAQSPLRAVGRLPSPYIRLTQSVSEVEFDQVVLEVRANTAGLETMAADVLLQYDPAVLRIERKKIKFPLHYGVFQISQAGEGVVDFSLFSNPERGEKALKTAINQEVLIATLAFGVLTDKARSTRVEVKFTPGSLDETNLIPYHQPRRENPVDILQGVEGITLTL